MPSLQFYVFRAVMPLMRRSQARLKVDDIDVLVRFRERANRMANIAFRLPQDVSIENDTIGGVAGDWLKPENAPDDPVLIFLHGGGMIFGWVNPNRKILAYIVKYSGLHAFGVDYRTMPGNPYPAAHQDCFNAYQSIVQSGKRVILVGESSGGVLALATMLRAKEAGLPQPLLSVMLGPAVDYSFQNALFWSFKDVFADPGYSAGLHRHYIAGCDPVSADLAPIHADLSGLGPFYVLVGENDITRPEAERLVEAAERYNLQIELEIWPHVWHAWYLFMPQLPEGTRAIKRLAEIMQPYITSVGKSKNVCQANTC